MNAGILSIGDELVSGLTVDTNSAWLADQLAAAGVSTTFHVTVGDDLERAAGAIGQACGALGGRGGVPCEGGILLVTGGLGPTEDDITRQALAAALGERLVEDAGALEQVERFFKAIQRPMAASNRVQAMRPEGARVVENRAGTAPGLHAVRGSVEIFVMPGVPREMKEMFTRAVLPLIRAKVARGGVKGGVSGRAEGVSGYAEGVSGCAEGGSGCVGGVSGDAEGVSGYAEGVSVRLAVKLNTFGMGESVLGEKIRDLMVRGGYEAEGARVSVGTTVNDGIVSVRIYAAGTAERAEAAIAVVRAEVMRRLGVLVFSEGDVPLEEAVEALLKEKRVTIATAESCTGGLLAALLTNVAGASGYFQRGWVTYANGAKEEELGVAAGLIEKHGAVSEEVARAMAEGARAAAGTAMGLSTTGIAGPGGGTADKPVGTVWIALADASGVEARRYIFPGKRGQVRLRAAQMGLAWVRWKLMGVEGG